MNSGKGDGSPDATLDHLKSETRRLLRARRAAISDDRLAQISARICEHVQRQALWRDARGVLMYLPMQGEVDVSALGRAASAAGKVIMLPRVDWQTRSMQIVAVESWPEIVERDSRGVPVPPAGSVTAELSRLDAVVIPGLGFDESGGRLGRGGGFYDRFLGDLSRVQPETVLIGVSAQELIVDRIPAGAMDVPVRWLASETGVRRCGSD